MEHKTSLSRQDLVVVLVGFALVVFVIVFFAAKHSLSRSQAAHEAREAAREERVAEVPSISPETALQKVISSEPPRILDFRGESDYAAFHIPDSYLVSPQDIPNLPFGTDEEAIIVAGDASVAREASVALAARGIVHFTIEGGLPAWETAGGTLINYGDPTSATDQSKVTLVGAEEFSALLQDQNLRYRLLDVRSSGEKIFEDAIWIPFHELEARRDEIPPATNVALCGTNGLEAFQAAVRLFDLGFVSVRTLDGGCEHITLSSEGE